MVKYVNGKWLNLRNDVNKKKKFLKLKIQTKLSAFL